MKRMLRCDTGEGLTGVLLTGVVLTSDLLVVHTNCKPNAGQPTRKDVPLFPKMLVNWFVVYDSIASKCIAFDLCVSSAADCWLVVRGIRGLLLSWREREACQANDFSGRNRLEETEVAHQESVKRQWKVFIENHSRTAALLTATQAATKTLLSPQIFLNRFASSLLIWRKWQKQFSFARI